MLKRKEGPKEVPQDTLKEILKCLKQLVELKKLQVEYETGQQIDLKN